MIGTGTVYLCRNSAGAVIYIGQTLQPKTRMKAHRAKSEWWNETVDVEQLRVPASELHSTERALIAQHDPVYNIAWTPRQPAPLRRTHSLRHARRPERHSDSGLNYYLRVSEVSRLLGCSVSTLHRWERDQRLVPVHLGTPPVRRYLAAAVDEFIDAIAPEQVA